MSEYRRGFLIGFLCGAVFACTGVVTLCLLIGGTAHASGGDEVTQLTRIAGSLERMERSCH